MSTRMMATERRRFDNKVFSEKIDGWTFEIWEEKNHKCCVVCVVRKGKYIAREHRYPSEYVLGLMASWFKGISWLEKELEKSTNE